MNENSLLCRFIKENPNDFLTKLYKNHDIKAKVEGDLAIFNYGHTCDFSSPLVQEARGIIINTRTLEIVSWPFRKFGNFGESYADEIDWDSARVLEKVDGSIVKLWYDEENEKWQFSTNATIRAEKASVDHAPYPITFGDVIAKAENLCNIHFDELDKRKTYIFELVSPLTRVVIDYGKTMLYHIGTRSNISGEESDEDIGVIKPRSYPLQDLESCINAVMALNRDGDNIEAEGFVVVDKNYHRIKIKSPHYLVQNKLLQTGSITKEDAIEMLISESPKIEVLTKARPDLIPNFKYYDYKLAELKCSANKLAALARGLYNEYDRDRAVVAKVLIRHKLSSVGFMALDREGDGEELLLTLPREKLLKLIEDYIPDDVTTILSK